MDLDDHEDLFEDDDFDDLPAATLIHLEQQARLSTQHAPGASQAKGGSWQHVTKPQQNGVGRELPSSDYGLDGEEDVIDLDAQPSFVHQDAGKTHRVPQDEVTRREQWRQERYGQTTPGLQSNNMPAVQPTYPNTQHIQRTGRKNHHFEATQNQPSLVEEGSLGLDGGQDIDISALQLRIQELEQQAQTLHKTAEDAKSAAFSKNGEVAIVRANQQKEAQEYERKMKLLQQQHAEEVAKSKADMDALRKDKEKFETDSKFQAHDLAEHARTARRTLKEGQGNANRSRPSPFSTPKKTKSMPLRDGFDDAEVAVVSPSKLKDRSKGATPKAGAKRKRSHQDEQVIVSPSLSFSGGEPMQQNDSNSEATRSFTLPTEPVLPQVRTDERFEFMQMILDHRTRDWSSRTLEILTNFYLPSTPKVSMASMIYDRLTRSPLQQELDQFRLHVCDAFILQWTKCLEEAYYDPLYDLTELLQYILVISPAPLSAAIVARLTPLCQSTTDLIAVPTAKALVDRNKNPLPTRTLKSKVDPKHYMDILHFIEAQSTSSISNFSSPSLDVVNFWSHVAFDFILTLLHRAQPIAHISSVLSLLHRSILPQTFGSIVPDVNLQRKVESSLVDRLTNFLVFEPQHPRPVPRKAHFSDFLHTARIEQEELERGALPIPEPYTTKEILQLRSTVLNLLYALALSDHGGQLLVAHDLAIGGLVRYLHDSVVKMYSTFNGPELALQGSNARESDSENVTIAADSGIYRDQSPDADLYTLHTAQINTIVTILYHLNTTYGSLTDSSQDSPQNQSQNRNQNQNQNQTPNQKAEPTLRPLLNIHAYLESQPSTSQAYLVALSRIAFSETWGLEAGIDAEVAEMAHDMLDEFVSPEDGEGVLGVFESGRISGV